MGCYLWNLRHKQSRSLVQKVPPRWSVKAVRKPLESPEVLLRSWWGFFHNTHPTAKGQVQMYGQKPSLEKKKTPVGDEMSFQDTLFLTNVWTQSLDAQTTMLQMHCPWNWRKTESVKLEFETSISMSHFVETVCALLALQC